MKGEVPTAYNDVVEVFVHPLPRQVEQSQLCESAVHCLPWSQPTYIV
jgi:hypothetical protein